VPRPDGREKGFWIESGFGFTGHGYPLLSLQARILRFRPRRPPATNVIPFLRKTNIELPVSYPPEAYPSVTLELPARVTLEAAVPAAACEGEAWAAMASVWTLEAVRAALRSVA
jgi:hypothetical protein